MLRHFRRLVLVLVPVVVLLIVPSCATKRPRQRPIEMGPVESGPGTLESVRKQLEGSWNLVSAEIVSAAGQRALIKASAVLTYDAYGNLTLTGAYEDPAATAEQTAALNFKGRAVIDTQKHELHLLDMRQTEGEFAALPPDMAARRVRAYAFKEDVLTLTVRDSTGKITAVNTWRRQPR